MVISYKLKYEREKEKVAELENRLAYLGMAFVEEQNRRLEIERRYEELTRCKEAECD